MKISEMTVLNVGAWALLALMVTSGCYMDRLTGNYDPIFSSEMLEKDNAILEETGRDEETVQKNTEILKKIAAEDDEVFRINAGDQIEIRVYGHADLTMTTKVSPDGFIGMVFLGQIRVSGMTIQEASKTIQNGLEPYVKHPVVGITVQEIASETVTISGACEKPGLYNISDSTRVADVYAMGGGSAVRLFHSVNVDVADLEHSLFVRDGNLIPIDFEKAIAGDPLNNIKVRRGDYIFIAQRLEASVTICGDVKSPQRRLYEQRMGLIETLTDVGWIKETHWSHVILIRNGLTNPKMYKVDVDGILAGRCKNVYLQPNDIVYVPHDNISEYNVFIRKLLPTAQLLYMLTTRLTDKYILD